MSDGQQENVYNQFTEGPGMAYQALWANSIETEEAAKAAERGE